MSAVRLTEEERRLADRLHLHVKQAIGSPVWQPGSRLEQRASEQLWKAICTLILEVRKRGPSADAE